MTTVIGMEASEEGSGAGENIWLEIHEPTGLVLIVAALIHSFLNRRQLFGYFTGLFAK